LPSLLCGTSHSHHIQDVLAELLFFFFFDCYIFVNACLNNFNRLNSSDANINIHFFARKALSIVIKPTVHFLCGKNNWISIKKKKKNPRHKVHDCLPRLNLWKKASAIWGL